MSWVNHVVDRGRSVGAVHMCLGSIMLLIEVEVWGLSAVCVQYRNLTAQF